MQRLATTLADLGAGIAIGRRAAGFGDRASITLRGAISLPSGGTVSRRCMPGTTEGNHLVSKLQAIQVGSVGWSRSRGAPWPPRG